MNWARLLARSWWHYRRTHLGVVLGVAVAIAVLAGVLMVGDSIRQTLRQLTDQRLGRIDLAMPAGDRLVRLGLADDLQKELGRPVAPVLILPGSALQPDSQQRANQVQVLGVGTRFWRLAMNPAAPSMPWDSDPPETPQACVNTALAAQLKIKPGDTILVQVAKPGALPGDAPLSPTEQALVGRRVKVAAIIDGQRLGNFSLTSGGAAPWNLYLPLQILAQWVEQPGKANLLLVGDGSQANPANPLPLAQQTLAKVWTLADAQLHFAPVSKTWWELSSERIFLDDAVASAARNVPGSKLGVLTYLVNRLRVGERSAPYSFVAAVGPLEHAAPATKPAAPGGTLPAALPSNPATAPGDHTAASLLPGLSDIPSSQVVINDWLAADLEAKVGDRLELSYFVLGSMRQLIEKTSTLTIKRITPMQGPAGDPGWMPAYPGLAKQENCRDWQPGFAIDLSRIRDKDEQYWDEHRGTPKGFIALDTGQAWWGNRFGNLTAIRWDMRTHDRAELERLLLAQLSPQAMGLNFIPLRQQALAAAGQSMDFGWLFLGFSLFLLVAAWMLTGLLFSFNLQQRRQQLGTLLALGWSPRQVRLLAWSEGMGLALAGAALGLLLGLLYGGLLLAGLRWFWSSILGDTSPVINIQPSSLALGMLMGLGVAAVTLWLGSRSLVRRSVLELWQSSLEQDRLPRSHGRSMVQWAILAILVLAAGGLWLLPTPQDSQTAAGLFFGAGVLWLLAGLLACRWTLGAWGQPAHGSQPNNPCLGLLGLGLRNTARQPARSLTTIGLLASGTFLVLAVQAYRLETPQPGQRHSGTGGFALWAQAARPILHDLNTRAGRDELGLPDDWPASVSVVPLRQKTGDDAGCLSLQRAQSPTLWAVDPQLLAARDAFHINGIWPPAALKNASSSPWLLLDQPLPDGAVPAIADQATLIWSLGKSLGDTLEFTDEQGHPFRVRLVASLSNSILQGGLVISERALLARYPSHSGYQVLLVDAPTGQGQRIERELSQSLANLGLEITPAADRLARFNAVQNTYLSIFQALGFLGLLLGSAGLGVVVLRNTMERRGELALMRAVGFTRAQLRWMVLSEHGWLLGLGVGIGALAGAAAVAPGSVSQGGALPWFNMLGLLLLLLASGLLWTLGAAAWALRGSPLEALRSE